MTDLIFIIQGYKELTDAGQMMDVTTIELYDTNVENALKRAKKLINKKGYRVASIIEKKHDSNTK